MQCIRTERHHFVVQQIHLIDVVFGDGAVDLQTHAEFFEMPKAIERGG